MGGGSVYLMGRWESDTKSDDEECKDKQDEPEDSAAVQGDGEVEAFVSEKVWYVHVRAWFRVFWRHCSKMKETLGFGKNGSNDGDNKRDPKDQKG